MDTALGVPQGESFDAYPAGLVAVQVSVPPCMVRGYLRILHLGNMHFARDGWPWPSTVRSQLGPTIATHTLSPKCVMLTAALGGLATPLHLHVELTPHFLRADADSLD